MLGKEPVGICGGDFFSESQGFDSSCSATTWCYKLYFPADSVGK